MEPPAMPSPTDPTLQPPKLLERIRTGHYSFRAEILCVDWVSHFVLLRVKRHPPEMNAIRRGIVSPLDAL